jgi:hypothetical protein
LTTQVSGTLPLANGGTGQTTAQAAINSLAGATTSGQYLRGNGTNVVMSAIQAGDVPTLNQNTTGSAATLTTARDIQTNLASTSAASFNGSANITPGVTGTLAVGNGGTGVTTSTGTGSVVLSTSPSLTTPSLSGETFSTSATVSAGTNAQGQGALTSDYNVITTASSNPSGVTLPTATTGRRIYIVNKGANPINVYPATSAYIDALAINASIQIPVNGIMEFNASSTTQWYSTATTVLSSVPVNLATGTLAVANGGTGQTTVQAAINALAGAVTSGQYLRGNGTNVVMSAIQAGDVPTLNQNTTGSAATLTTARDIQINLASTSAASFNGSANITPGVTGTLAVGNGGTGITSFGTGVATFLGTPSSANLAAAVTDETGFTTGALLVFNTSPSFTTGINAGSTTMALFNATATTINMGAAATAINVGASNGTVTFANNVVVSNKLEATTKSFVIDHPTKWKEGMKLRYACLEGPENGVYVRGVLTDDDTIELPEYWVNLVDTNSITVNLTPIGSSNGHYVKSIKDNVVTVGSRSGNINCHYIVYGERKDVSKLVIEYHAAQ